MNKVAFVDLIVSTRSSRAISFSKFIAAGLHLELHILSLAMIQISLQPRLSAL